MAERESVLRHYGRAFFAGGVLSLTRLATGFVRIKYVALVLGTTGIGLLSQATQLQLLGISIASLSIPVGIINRMGAIGENPPAERRLFATAFTAQIVVTVTLVASATIFSRLLEAAVFGTGALERASMSRLDLLAVVFSVPLSVVASGFLEAVFFGSHRYDLYVRASVWATLLGFVSTLAIIWVWRLPGAFWSIFVSSVFLAGAFVYYVGYLRPYSTLFQFGFDWNEANSLIRFSIAIFMAGALVPGARLWVQRYVIAAFGLDANGLLQVPFAVNAYYTPFLTNALWGRMHPAIARVGATPDGRRELTTGLRLTIVMATAAIVAILFLKDLLVPLAYSRAFVPATRLLPVQLFGDFFYFVAFPFTVYALGISRLRVYLSAWCAYSAAAVIASIAFIGPFGLAGVPAGYAFANVLGAAIAVIWLVTRREEGLGATLAIIFLGLLAVSLQTWLAWRGELRVVQGAIVVVTSAAAVGWLWIGRRA